MIRYQKSYGVAYSKRVTKDLNISESKVVHNDEYIELNRTFHELSNAQEIEDVSNYSLHYGENEVGWCDLLKEYRVIILAKAGAGKTWEIRHTARKLLKEVKNAFFMRLEYVAQEFKASFEVGTYEGLQSWLGTNSEGWFFLDSVDESRLKHPKDFERSIRIIGSVLHSAMQRAHIIITARPVAWRQKTDLDLCNSTLPYFEPLKQERGHDSADVEGQIRTQEPTAQNEQEIRPTFKFYSLVNLVPEQVGKYLEAKGIREVDLLIDKINKREAWWRTESPQDLDELHHYWNQHQEIGSHMLLIQHSISHRLTERDQDRAEVNPLSVEKATSGIKTIAAAVTLTRETVIQVPDGLYAQKGIPCKSVLLEWEDKECQTLLDRPIFDPAIYGTVRFHHRTVREYLAAKWFSELLINNASRQKIEYLFFREQYGRKVITPSMRPILSWLILFDEKICNRALSIDPEVVFEGGDPTQLPRPVRESILMSTCERILSGYTDSHSMYYESVQRFAHSDLAAIVKTLLKKYEAERRVVDFLIRMVWIGEMRDCLPEAKACAINPLPAKFTRIAAIRAVTEMGTESDHREMLASFTPEDDLYDREVLAELINGLSGTPDSMSWVFSAIQKAEDRQKHSTDKLRYSLIQFAKRLDINDVAKFAMELIPLLNQPPVIEKRYCEVSEKFAWLLDVCGSIIEGLIISRHDEALNPYVLSVLEKIPMFRQYVHYDGYRKITYQFSNLIPQWPELNDSLFWKTVEDNRDNSQRNSGSVTDYRHVWIWSRGYWRFEAKDFDRIAADISRKELLDDRLVALSLAFNIYKENRRPRKWKERLKKIANQDEELKSKLHTMLNPPPQSKEDKKWKRQESEFQRRETAELEKGKKKNEEWKNWLSDNLETLRDTQNGDFTNGHLYLYEKMREYDLGHTHWSVGNWESLLDEFSIDVVESFKEGAAKYWRAYKPELLSEGAKRNSTPYKVIFGLVGLAIISSSDPEWLIDLTNEEVELACRYACHELNGFPEWFPRLFEHYTEIVRNFLLKEIEWDLATVQDVDFRHYVLGKVSGSSRWMWDKLAEGVLEALQREPDRSRELGSALAIIQASSTVSNEALGILASEKCKTITSLDHLKYWFSAWIGVDPESAIHDLSSHLERIQDSQKATELAMHIVIHLAGDKESALYVRDTYKSPSYLKQLYLLIHQYIKVEEDTRRKSGEAYSPGLRDDAQHARSNLFSMLSDIEGKEAYLAMLELSKAHPVEGYKHWALQSAIRRAAKDADVKPFSVEQFVEFSRSLEFTPSTHKELFELAHSRLIDLRNDLEEGDSSIASLLIDVSQETEIRKYIGNWCREKSSGKYSIVQEEEFADGKKPDFRFHLSSIDAPVPVELKLADKWTGSQLSGDYLRDMRSSCGIFLLMHQGRRKKAWKIPATKKNVDFDGLIYALREHWEEISCKYPDVDTISILGINLTKRAQ